MLCRPQKNFTVLSKIKSDFVPNKLKQQEPWIKKNKQTKKKPDSAEFIEWHFCTKQFESHRKKGRKIQLCLRKPCGRYRCGGEKAPTAVVTAATAVTSRRSLPGVVLVAASGKLEWPEKPQWTWKHPREEELVVVEEGVKRWSGEEKEGNIKPDV